MRFSKPQFTMSIRILMFALILTSTFLSCNSESKTKNAETSSEIPENNKSIDQDTLQKVQIKTNLQACKYDQAKQTDEFIRTIDELDGYDWDDKEKTASLVLNDHWGLNLKRGGCDHFELSATFIYDRHLDLEENKAMIFDQVKWITALIEEFDSEQIAFALDNGKIFIQEVSDGDYFINFTDERLYEFYQFRYRTWEDATNFKIGKYIE